MAKKSQIVDATVKKSPKKKAKKRAAKTKNHNMIDEAAKPESKVGVTVSTASQVDVTLNGVPQLVPIKIDEGTESDWLSTKGDAENYQIVPEPYDGFMAIMEVGGDGEIDGIQGPVSVFDGKKISDGDVIQVQFPKAGVIQLTAQVHGGYAFHHSWWGGVAVSVPLTGLPARRIG